MLEMARTLYPSAFAPFPHMPARNDSRHGAALAPMTATQVGLDNQVVIQRTQLTLRFA
jgi:hypothetical protein